MITALELSPQVCTQALDSQYPAQTIGSDFARGDQGQSLPAHPAWQTLLGAEAHGSSAGFV